MDKKLLKEFLDEKVVQYNNPQFIESDPIQIPHRFSRKEDIEISGFLVATIAWGQRKTIINNGLKLMDLMGDSPYDFVMQFSEKDEERLSGFVHRTFNSIDLTYFMYALQHIYQNHSGMEIIFSTHAKNDSLQLAIHHFKKVFFEFSSILVFALGY